jgi:uncharacterized protein involved in response to NO
VLWALIFSGTLAPPPAPFSPSQWHAHEMFFGFGWAVLGGFLLTSTKNWVKIRGYHGTALILLVAPGCSNAPACGLPARCRRSSSASPATSSWRRSSPCCCGR